MHFPALQRPCAGAERKNSEVYLDLTSKPLLQVTQPGGCVPVYRLAALAERNSSLLYAVHGFCHNHETN